jgi:hypothetical protein
MRPTVRVAVNPSNDGADGFAARSRVTFIASAVAHNIEFGTLNTSTTMTLSSFRRRWTTSILLSAALGIAGCVTDERAVNNPEDTETRVGPVTVTALARSEVVRLRWRQDPPLGSQISYIVTWKPAGGGAIAEGDTGSRFVNWHDGTDGTPFAWKTFEAEIGPLGEKLYEFRVNVMTSGQAAPAATKLISAAPAARYTTDASRPLDPIRLYEPASSMQLNGLIIDPSKGGPRVVSIAEAPAASVQLAMVLGNGEPVLQIASTTAWETSGKCDPDVYTVPDAAAGDLYAYIPLDEWYRGAPGPIDASNWIVSGRYYFLKDGGLGYYRLGEQSSPVARFVRISTVKGEGGRFLQGTAPNRYVELELSVGHPGVRFA